MVARDVPSTYIQEKNNLELMKIGKCLPCAFLLNYIVLLNQTSLSFLITQDKYTFYN